MFSFLLYCRFIQIGFEFKEENSPRNFRAGKFDFKRICVLLNISVNKSCLEFELFLFSSLDGAGVGPTFFSGVVFDSLEIFLSLASSILAMIDSRFRFLDF